MQEVVERFRRTPDSHLVHKPRVEVVGPDLVLGHVEPHVHGESAALHHVEGVEVQDYPEKSEVREKTQHTKN